MSAQTDRLLAYLEANEDEIAEAFDQDEEAVTGQIQTLRRSVEAFVAMREALVCTTSGLEALERLHPSPCSVTALPMAFEEYAAVGRAALKLAEGVSK